MAFLARPIQPPRPRSGPLVQSDGTLSQNISGWFRHVWETVNFNSQALSGGLSVTITTAKLTAGGSNGSMTFTNGILTAQTPAT